MRTLAGQIPKIWGKILRNKHTLNTIKLSICVLHFNLVSKTPFSYKFEPMRSLLDLGDRRDEDSNEFLSAVCWRHQCPVIVAANFTRHH